MVNPSINLTQNDPYGVYSLFSEHRKYSVFFKYEQIASYYALLLISVGTVCNLFSFFVMMRPTMRRQGCMRCLAALALTDMLVLYQWNLNMFVKYNLSKPPDFKDLEDISLFFCRWISFLAYFSLQSSSW
jgi:hypothetical protein